MRRPISLCLAAFLAFATTNAAGGDAPAEQPANDGSFSWLLGRWTGRNETGRWGLIWSEPNRLRRPRKWTESERALTLRLELTFTNAPTGLTGTVDAVAADDKRTSVVSFTIARTPDDCVLTWQEGGVSYRFGLEGTGGAYRLAPGDIERSNGQRFLRFGRRVRSPRHASRSRDGMAYPFIIEFRMLEGNLNLRRVQGPQHGAAVNQQYTFARRD